jgi:hypothetical protein
MQITTHTRIDIALKICSLKADCSLVYAIKKDVPLQMLIRYIVWF